MEEIKQDSSTPAHGLQVISACAFVHYDFDGVQKLFLAKRADTKKFLPGFYEMPGGHIDFGEEIVAGLKREIKEEHSMTIRVGDPFYACTYINEMKGSHSIQVNFFAEFIEPLDQITINPKDHSTFGWFSKEEVIALHKEIAADKQVVHDYEDDTEYLAMIRGFELLQGSPLRFK